MARPRFLFLSGQSWRKDGVGVARPWYAWRLVGANNRPLAASWGQFASLPDCHNAVAELQERLIEGRLGLVADASTGLWSWQLAVDDHGVAVSARSYHRQRECRYNADAFLVAAPMATAAADLLMLPRGRGQGPDVPRDQDGEALAPHRILTPRRA